ncbi:MAG: ABC transporter permease subunit [Deinococcales bacterium]
MFQALKLAIWEDNALLRLKDSVNSSRFTVSLAQGTLVDIIKDETVALSPEELAGAQAGIERWYLLEFTGDSGPLQAWAPESRIRLPENTEAIGALAPVLATVRSKIGSSDPLTSVYVSPDDNSEVISKLAARTEVRVVEGVGLEHWYLIHPKNTPNKQGWASANMLQIYNDQSARIDRGNQGQFTLKFIQKMFNDRFFRPALLTTLLLTLLIIPVQFVLAIIMALIIQSRIKGSGIFLYIFAIPLGVSELAVGILFFAIFTQNGLLNSSLESLGLIAKPITFLSADNKTGIIIAIWLAEIWRATSLVMVIVVSGLQAISDEILEAAEIFGAGLWQRVRFVILPLLKPSLQVALILRTILALQVFAVVVALSGGDVVSVLANESFRQYSDLRNYNVAAAYAGLILLISMVSAVIYLRTLRAHEEAGL